MSMDTNYPNESLTDIPYNFVITKNRIALKIYGREFNLESLARKFGTPLDIAFPHTSVDRIDSIFSNFRRAAESSGFNAKLSYFYPMKVNPRKEILTEILRCTNSDVGIEVGDVFELRILLNNFSSEIKHRKLVFHGPKSKEYLDQITKLNDRGFDVIMVLEDPMELYELRAAYKKKIKLGVRINTGEKDRFGMSLKDAIDISSSIRDDLALLHLHFGEPVDLGQLRHGLLELGTLLKNLSAEQIKSLIIDAGGGITFSDAGQVARYGLKKYFGCVINAIKELNLNLPHSIMHVALEAGRWVAAVSQLTIFKTIQLKHLNNKYRYVIDGSFITDLPDTWGINKKWTIFPINLLNLKRVKAYLDGVTCDSDDLYTKVTPELISLPKLNSTNKELFLCIAYTGAYQDTLGNHHCAIPDAIKILIDESGGVKRINSRQFDDMQRIFGYGK